MLSLGSNFFANVKVRREERRVISNMNKQDSEHAGILSRGPLKCPSTMFLTWVIEKGVYSN